MTLKFFIFCGDVSCFLRNICIFVKIISITNKMAMENRELRIFISSTFKDMQSERDWLMTNVFPVLRLKAAARGVTLTEVDLRWGITEEEASQGLTIPICLDEIEQSRPFFIGLLGNRYGWTPSPDDVKGSALPPRYSWIIDELREGKSITEIEFEYGVLRSPEKIYASFFLRDDSEPDDNPRLSSLKRQLCAQDKYPVNRYSDVEELGRMVYDRFIEILDELYPEETSDSVSAERNSTLAAAKASAHGYLCDNRTFEPLTAFIADGQPGERMLVTGAAGAGKSSLLSYAALRWIEQGVPVVLVLGGLSPQLPEGVVDQVKAELKKLEPGETAPVVIIDSVESIMGENTDLSWLDTLPDTCRLILSVADDSSLSAPLAHVVGRRISIFPLLVSQRRQLAKNYFESYAKRITDSALNLLVRPMTLMDNTLLYVTMLDEVRTFGNFDRLPEFIDTIGSLQTPNEFYDFILGRHEQLYATPRFPDILRDVLGFVCLADKGLDETELMALTGLPMMHLSRVLLGSRDMLRRRGGIISFAHRMIEDAVGSRYFSGPEGEELERDMRQRAADYFRDNSDNKRGRMQLLWQLWHLGRWQELYEIIGRNQYLREVINDAHGRARLVRYWDTLLRRDTVRYELGVYIDDFEDGLNFDDNEFRSMLIGALVTIQSEFLTRLLNLLIPHLSTKEAVRRLCGRMLLWLGEGNEYDDLRSGWLISLAHAECRMDNYAEALQLCAQSLQCDKADDFKLNNIADIYLTIAERTDKRLFFERAADIQRQVLDIRIDRYGRMHRQVAVAMSNLASSLVGLGRMPEADKLMAESTEIFTALDGDGSVDVVINLNNQAHTLFENGRYEEALDISRQALDIYSRMYGDNAQTVEMVALQMMILKKLSHTDEYNGLKKRYLGIVRALTPPERMAAQLANSAMSFILKHLDDSAWAIEVVKEALTLEETDVDITALLHNILGQAYADMGRVESADEEYAIATDIYKEKGDFAKVFELIGARAKALMLAGDYDKACQLYEEAFDLKEAKELPDSDKATFMLQNYAVAALNKGDVILAGDIMEHACRMRADLHGDDDEMLQKDYLPTLQQLRAKADNDDAEPENRPEHSDVARFRELVGDDDEIGDVYARASAAFRRGSLTEALHLLGVVTKNLGDNPAAMAWVKRSIAYAHEMSGDLDEAEKYYSEAFDESLSFYRLPSLLCAITHDYVEFEWNRGNYERAAQLYMSQFAGALFECGRVTREVLNPLCNQGTAILKCYDAGMKDADLEYALHCGALAIIFAESDEDLQEHYQWACNIVGKSLNLLGIPNEDFDISVTETLHTLALKTLHNGESMAAIAITSLYCYLTPDSLSPAVEFEREAFSAMAYSGIYPVGALKYLERAREIVQQHDIEIPEDMARELAETEIVIKFGKLLFDEVFNLGINCSTPTVAIMHYTLFSAFAEGVDVAHLISLLEESDPNCRERYGAALQMARLASGLDADLDLILNSAADNWYVHCALPLALHYVGQPDRASALYHKLANESPHDADERIAQLWFMRRFMLLTGNADEAELIAKSALDLIERLSNDDDVFSLYTNAFLR